MVKFDNYITPMPERCGTLSPLDQVWSCDYRSDNRGAIVVGGT